VIVTHQHHQLKLGKGVAFVKSQLRRLRQEDDAWEVDFQLMPSWGCWVGTVISQTDYYILADRHVDEPPTVNDLARLLADAMLRPFEMGPHRPSTIYVRNRPEWIELLPHLKQLGIKVDLQESLPKWDEAFDELCTRINQSKSVRKTEPTPGKKKPMASTKRPATKTAIQDQVRLYTLEVFILGGPVSEKFAKNNPVISRTIQIRGDHTLLDLHNAIFDAFGRWEEHGYEFQFGKGPMDPKALRYVLPGAFEIDMGEEKRPAGRVDETTIESLALKVDNRFGYWFDFGDDWWHQINVEAIEDKVPKGNLPRVTKKVGKSPPQYAGKNE
jgi:hypothetical protein